MSDELCLLNTTQDNLVRFELTQYVTRNVERSTRTDGDKMNNEVKELADKYTLEELVDLLEERAACEESDLRLERVCEAIHRRAGLNADNAVKKALDNFRRQQLVVLKGIFTDAGKTVEITDHQPTEHDTFRRDRGVLSHESWLNIFRTEMFVDDQVTFVFDTMDRLRDIKILPPWEQ